LTKEEEEEEEEEATEEALRRRLVSVISSVGPNRSDLKYSVKPELEKNGQPIRLLASAAFDTQRRWLPAISISPAPEAESFSIKDGFQHFR
jgi:hypothetical protein